MTAIIPTSINEISPASLADDDSLRRLYDSHASALLGYLVRYLRGDRQQAEDVVQETLLRAWRHPEAQSVDGEWSRQWLLTVARRIAIDHLRTAAARAPEVYGYLLEGRTSDVDEFDRSIDAHEIWTAVMDLPYKQRRAVFEIYYRERSINEAAERLGVPPGTVKSRTYYALSALRKALGDRGF